MQKLVSGMAAAFCVAGLMGASAFAAGGAEATLANALNAPRSAVVDGRAWACDGNKCTAGNSGRSQPPVRECARFVREFGAVTAYRVGDKVLDADQLRACNG